MTTISCLKSWEIDSRYYPYVFAQTHKILHLLIGMKHCLLAIVGLLTAATTSIATHYQSILGNNDQDLYLVELGPGQTRWIAEEEKWALRRVCSYHPPLENKLRL